MVIVNTAPPVRIIPNNPLKRGDLSWARSKVYGVFSAATRGRKAVKILLNISDLRSHISDLISQISDLISHISYLRFLISYLISSDLRYFVAQSY